MPRNARAIALAALLLAAPSLAFAPSVAFAKEGREGREGREGKEAAAGHPGLAEIHGRVDVQLARIHTERKEGEITGAQAHGLAAVDRGIAHQAAADAKANGGHLTAQQYRDLNAGLNANSRAIGR